MLLTGKKPYKYFIPFELNNYPPPKPLPEKLEVWAVSSPLWKEDQNIPLGVYCYETDTGKAKMGVGKHLYSTLPYIDDKR
jgi:hypothetical protein